MSHIASMHDMSGVHRLALYASRSCAPKQWDLATFAAAISKSRLQGVQLSLSELGRDSAEQKESSTALMALGLSLIVDIQSLPCSTSFRNGNDNNIVNYINAFESQLLSVDALDNVVTHINCCHSGDHLWDIATAAEYLGNILPLSAQYLENHPHIGRCGREVDIMGGSPPHLTGISHMTGVGILNTLEQTHELLEILPPLRMTMAADIQNSVLSDDGNTNKDYAISMFKAEFTPHFDHICWGGAAAKNSEILWKQVWSRKATRGVEEMSVTLDVPKAVDIHCCTEQGESLPSEILELANVVQSSFDDWKTKR